MPPIAVTDAKVYVRIAGDAKQPGLEGSGILPKGVQAVPQAHKDFRRDVGIVGIVATEVAGEGEDQRSKATEEFVPDRLADDQKRKRFLDLSKSERVFTGKDTIGWSLPPKEKPLPLHVEEAARPGGLSRQSPP